MSSVHLNKRTVIDAGSCTRLAWFRVRDRGNPSTPPSAADLLLQRWGVEVGELARRHFPDGILIDEKDFNAALRATRNAMSAGHGVLFEPAFAFDGIAMRADVLRWNGDGFGLIEVKAGVSPDDYYEDVAVQVLVLEGLGYRVRPHLMLLDRESTITSPSWFKIVACEEEVREILPEIRSRLAAIQDATRSPEPPAVPYTRACRDCDYRSECLPNLPEYSVFTLHRGGALVDNLLARGVYLLTDVPADAKLSICQKRQIECVRMRQPWVSSTLADELASVAFPLYFLDFEAVRLPIPEYAGQHPYDLAPFQFSVHLVADENADPIHREFLWAESSDPRRACAEALVEAVGKLGSIVVYTNFEEQVVKALAEVLPDQEGELLGLLPRLVDLHAVVKENVYHPSFNGSYSIKHVLPALVPSMSYDGMQIRDGMAAVLAWIELRDPETPLDRRSQIAADLLAYCRLDSLAMTEVWRALRGMAVAGV